MTLTLGLPLITYLPGTKLHSYTKNFIWSLSFYIYFLDKNDFLCSGQKKGFHCYVSCTCIERMRMDRCAIQWCRIYKIIIINH